MRKLAEASGDVAPPELELKYEFEVNEFLDSTGGEPLGPLMRQQLIDKLRGRDLQITQMHQRIEQLWDTVVHATKKYAVYKNVVKEVCRAWYAGMSVDLLDAVTLDSLKELGEKALVEEYAAELEGSGKGESEKSVHPASFGATRAKISLAAAQEVIRQGLKYRGCDVVVVGSGGYEHYGQDGGTAGTDIGLSGDDSCASSPSNW